MAQLALQITKRTDPNLLQRMKNHYSRPKGFVGRNICYAVYWGGDYYGHIVAGSATRFLPGRNEFLDIDLSKLNNVINNVFFNISKINGRYPKRNFTSFVLKEFMRRAAIDWKNKYGDKVMGFESLIEPPRNGDLYKKAGWQYVGTTKGFTCKRMAGKSSDGWTGIRVWNKNKDELRPKLVFCYKWGN